MKYSFLNLIYFLVILSLSNKTHAAEGLTSTGDEKLTCAVRLSNVPIAQAIDVTKQPQFCSGTMIDSSTLVTAAHCLNQISASSVGDLDNVKKEKPFHLALPGERASEKALITAGQDTAVSSPIMNQQSARDLYIRTGETKMTNHDFVVVKLSAPIQGLESRKCPRLPTPEDCQVMKQEMNTTEKGSTLPSGRLKAFLFQSQERKSGSGAGKKTEYFPNEKLISAESTSTIISKNIDVMISQFQSQSEPVKIRKGDSGSGVIWSKGQDSILVGILSGAAGDNPTRAFFAQLCSHVESPRWTKLITEKAAMASSQRPANSPVTAPVKLEQKASGAQ